MRVPFMPESRAKGFGASWQCPYCRKRFQKKSMAQSHILNKHGVKKNG